METRSSPEALWPLVSDTDRLNRDRGNASIVVEGGGPNGRRRIRLGRGRFLERPYEWVRPRRYAVAREFPPGNLFMSKLDMIIVLDKAEGGGSLVAVELAALPSTVLGRLALPSFIRLQRGAFLAAFERYDRELLEGRAARGSAARGAAAEAHGTAVAEAAPRLRFRAVGRPSLAKGGAQRLAAGRAALEASGASPELVSLLCAELETAEEAKLAKMRPYALASAWGKERREVLGLLLAATRAGLLELRWELLCPLCRNARDSRGELGALPEKVHCEACNIDFGTNFERSVELNFRPVPSLREVGDLAWCVGGPGRTPHIAVQQLLGPGEERSVDLDLETGDYRIRVLGAAGGSRVTAAAGGVGRLELRFGPGGWAAAAYDIGLSPRCALVNSSSEERLFILERTAWTDEACTAGEVFALQAFRDLFSREALRPGRSVWVGSTALVFADLRGSTRLYRESGDAVAFGRVMEHFDLLKKTVSEEGGAIVKTIGDSVMAVFPRPLSALRAVLKAKAAIASLAPPGTAPLKLKAGIHFGPCIAVTLNERLDYFGTTVNLASRLEGLSDEQSVVLSREVRADPEVADFLSRASGRLGLERFEGRVKGLEDENLELWRLRTGAPVASRSSGRYSPKV